MSSPVIAQTVYPLIQQLSEVILGTWHQYLDLSPFALPEGLGYIEGKLEEEHLVIENTCYQSQHFRKMHLEMAKVGKNLDILHCVMFPRPEYPLPMFGCDLVGNPRGVSAAIMDLSPTGENCTLSESYQQHLRASQLDCQFSEPRVLPEWGVIFSEFCVFVRPVSHAEEQQFLKRTQEFLSVHCQLALESKLLSQEEQMTYLAGQRHYCREQQRNDKTRKVLEKAFDPDWAERYMSQVLFDIPDNA